VLLYCASCPVSRTMEIKRTGITHNTVFCVCSYESSSSVILGVALKAFQMPRSCRRLHSVLWEPHRPLGCFRVLVFVPSFLYGFPGGKAARTCRGQRMPGAIPPLAQYVFMPWCLVKHRDNFTMQFLFWAFWVMF
jgi:hypothetical protein